MTDLEIMQTLIKAKELGITQDDVEAFKAKLLPRETIVPDMKASDILAPISSFDDLSDEEILYWASPYYDDIQTKKEAQKQKLAENMHE